MTDYEGIVNSGKMYKVMELSDEGFHFNEALRQMERFNTLGYTEDAEKEKQHILREILYLIFNYPHKHYTFKHFEV